MIQFSKENVKDHFVYFHSDDIGRDKLAARDHEVMMVHNGEKDELSNFCFFSMELNDVPTEKGRKVIDHW